MNDYSEIQFSRDAHMYVPRYWKKKKDKWDALPHSLLWAVNTFFLTYVNVRGMEKREIVKSVLKVV